MNIVRVLFISTLVFISFLGCEEKSTSEEVVFVCTHGAARSPIASAYFNKLAKENKLKFHSIFRGTEPNESLTNETIKGLTKDGFTIKNWKPKKVTSKDIETAYKIVTFDCSVEIKNPQTIKEEWNGTPSISEDYEIARNTIKGNVEKLIAKLKMESLAK